jgi:diadenosine tetraphosphate (Ap4A) HIT family hydrolase
MKRKNSCDFCKDNFPDDYQVVSKTPKDWLFMLNREPQSDFHCMIVSKRHVYGLADNRLSNRAMEEFGVLLKKACISIKEADSSIQKILVVSLNIGKGSKHLHFHLIPRRWGEPVKMLNKPKEDGNGMFFLGRKEIAASLFVDFLNSTTGTKSEELKNRIKKATKVKVTKNAQRLRKIFNKIWLADNNPIQRTAYRRR